MQVVPAPPPLGARSEGYHSRSAAASPLSRRRFGGGAPPRMARVRASRPSFGRACTHAQVVPSRGGVTLTALAMSDSWGGGSDDDGSAGGRSDDDYGAASEDDAGGASGPASTTPWKARAGRVAAARALT